MADEGAFALTPGPVQPSHIRALVTAGPGHAIAIDDAGEVVIAAWTAPDALADNGAYTYVWTWREFHSLFGHQDKLKLTKVWLARLAGIANRQLRAIANREDYDTELWLRYPQPGDDPFDRLAHAVATSQIREIRDPDRLARARAEVAVRSPLTRDFGGRRGYDLTFGDLDDLYRRLTETEGSDD